MQIVKPAFTSNARRPSLCRVFFGFKKTRHREGCPNAPSETAIHAPWQSCADTWIYFFVVPTNIPKNCGLPTPNSIALPCFLASLEAPESNKVQILASWCSYRQYQTSITSTLSTRTDARCAWDRSLSHIISLSIYSHIQPSLIGMGRIYR